MAMLVKEYNLWTNIIKINNMCMMTREPDAKQWLFIDFETLKTWSHIEYIWNT